MTIIQLPPTVTDNLTDEVAVDQSGATFKTTWQRVIPVLLSGLGVKVQTFTLNANSSKTIAFSDTNQGVVIVSGIQTARQDMLIYSTGSGQSVVFNRILNASAIGVTDSSDASEKKMTVSNNSAGTVHGVVFVFFGGDVTIS